MKANERFINTLNGQETDRMPMIENSFWWHETIRRWHGEGLPICKNYAYGMKDVLEIQEYFGLDLLAHWWAKPYTGKTPFAKTVGAGMGGVTMEKYEKELLPTLYPDLKMDDDFVRMVKKLQSEGKLVLELIINGAFWEPREYMGIEPHLYSFYDNAELYHRMVADMLRWQKKTVAYALETLPFDYVTIAEDMSYNNGPMVGEEMFEEFIAPYYKEIVPLCKEAGLKVLVDSDGNITEPIKWFNRYGVEGYHPLEAQAGVDVNELQRKFPETAFIGNYNKMVMDKGEAAMRREFERLLPCIRRGRYVLSVDHQTPPSVSLEDYRVYIKLLKEFAWRKN